MVGGAGAVHSTNLSGGPHTTSAFVRNHEAISGAGVNPGALRGAGDARFGNHLNNNVGHLNNNAAFIHNQGFAHPANAHVYNQTFIGNQSIRMAGMGYHPSYYAHSFYHGPWSGNAWGWGWGLGPGVARRT